MSERDAAKAESHAFMARMGLATILVVVVFALNVGGNGMLASADFLLISLHFDPQVAAENLDDPFAEPWPMGEVLPYRYRPLFRWLVLGAYDVGLVPHTPEGFFGLFITSSALALLLALLCLDWFLREVGFSDKEGLVGMTLFGLGFPVLFAYDIPVQTREDLLGYAWIALILVAVARARPWAVALLGVVGAAIRETCLLGVLPFWFVSQRKTQEKVLAYAIPGVAWLILRKLLSTGESYAYLSISTAPTLEWPLEALLYLFAAFGVLWVAAGLRLVQGAPSHPLLQPRVALLALVAVAGTGWTMGMVRENRITYVLFPWLVALSLDLFRSQRFRRVLRAPAAWAAGLMTLGLGLATIAWLMADPERSQPFYANVSPLFHLGVAPPALAELDGEWVIVEAQIFASALNGPVVLLHLAASAFLGVGWWVTRGNQEGGQPVAEGPGQEEQAQGGEGHGDRPQEEADPRAEASEKGPEPLAGEDRPEPDEASDDERLDQAEGEGGAEPTPEQE
jgi:hypothetical protein